MTTEWKNSFSCKRRGFIFSGSEIYGGLAGTYDYGHFGLALKNNIKQNWWKKFVDNRRDMFGIDRRDIDASGSLAKCRSCNEFCGSYVRVYFM